MDATHFEPRGGSLIGPLFFTCTINNFGRHILTAFMSTYDHRYGYNMSLRVSFDNMCSICDLSHFTTGR